MYCPSFDSSFKLKKNSKTNVIKNLEDIQKILVYTLLTVTNNMWFGYLVKNTSSLEENDI